MRHWKPAANGQRLHDDADPGAARTVSRAHDDRHGPAQQAGREPGAARVHRAHLVVVRGAEGSRRHRAGRRRHGGPARGAPHRPRDAHTVTRAHDVAARRTARVAHADPVVAAGRQSARRVLPVVRPRRQRGRACGHRPRDGQHPRSRDGAGAWLAGQARRPGPRSRRRLSRLGARDRAPRADGGGSRTRAISTFPRRRSACRTTSTRTSR